MSCYIHLKAHRTDIPVGLGYISGYIETHLFRSSAAGPFNLDMSRFDCVQWTVLQMTVCVCVCVCNRFTSGHTRTLACLVPLCSCKHFTSCCRDVIIVSTTSPPTTLTSVSRRAGSITRLKRLTSGLALRT